MDPYQAALIQSEITVVVRRADRDEIITRNLRRMFELLEWTVMRVGRVKLALTPEYCLMGQYRPRTVDEWLDIAMPLPNRFTEMVAEEAVKLDCYIQTHFLERNDDWPGRYFNTTVVIGPDGRSVLTYRKHNGPNNLNTTYTGPADVYDEYVRRFGEDALFPVADTPIGKLGVMVCGDLLYPEVARALALKGAEVVLHPTAEPFRPEMDAWDAMRRARATENGCYFLSCNAGAFLGSNRPRSGYAGRSQAYGPAGEVIGLIPESGEAVINVTVDVERVRRLRAASDDSGHSHNALVQIRSDLYAREYARADRWPTNAFITSPRSTTSDARGIAANVAERLVRAGIHLPPANR